MGKGQTFLADDETPRGVVKHLRVVISGALEWGEDKKPRYLVVSVTTWHEGVRRKDSSCILEAGCHPFIKHKSWIDYARAEPMTYAKIFNGLRRGTFIDKEDMPPDTLARIQAGARISDNFPEELTRFFGAF